jgi:hypothetical protein
LNKWIRDHLDILLVLGIFGLPAIAPFIMLFSPELAMASLFLSLLCVAYVAYLLAEYFWRRVRKRVR